MRARVLWYAAAAAALPAALPACTASAPRAVVADTAALVAAPEGFSGPESVRYDADQDVYFVGNWNGDPGQRDNNGFISRMSPDGAILQLRFIAGGQNGVTLHAPRGMFIVGDTLWAADTDALRAFHRRTGAPLATVDFSTRDVGFLNDVAAGPDRVLYLTDTGRNKIYRIQGGQVSEALADTALSRPNGITWDAANRRFIVVPIGGGRGIFAWTPGGALTPIGSTETGSRFDGVEVLAGGGILVASQGDKSLQLFSGGTGRPVARTSGSPADIAVDTRRQRAAVPFVALNKVEIWQLPRR